jgi:hypothetical protein
MEKNKDIFVVKACFNDYAEISDIVDCFREKFGDGFEILCINVDDPNMAEAYWAGRRDNVKVEIEKLTDDAVIPSYKKEGGTSMSLKCTSLEYNYKTDTYAYHTGLKIKRKPNGVHIVVKPAYAKECYLSDYVGFGDGYYEGEIILYFKNRTPFSVLLDMDEFADVMDCAPFYPGEEIAEIAFVNSPEVEFI